MNGRAAAKTFLLAAGLAASLSAQQTVRIPKVSRPPSLADFEAGTPREAEAVIADFRQRVPGDGIPASLGTRAYLSYDSSALYIVFECEDDPGLIRSHMAPREQIDDDDAVIVLLDTFQSRQRYYSFAANPYGIQMDSARGEGLQEDRRFDTIWRTESRLTPKGYLVLFAIPFRNLRFPHQQSQQWGIALGRRIYRLNEYSYWPHLSTRVEGFAQQFGLLLGLEGISPGRNIRLVPYAAYANARTLNRNAVLPFFERASEARGGLDAKAVLRDAATLDLTVNPDFSQVETNDPQVTINRRFEVFFPELRPFFLENANYFQTPFNLFFSRRIRDPQFGARLTGKSGRWTYGLLSADDRSPALPVSSTAPDSARAVAGVGRLQYEFANQSNLGVLVTSYDLAGRGNRVFAADGRWKLSPTWLLSWQAGSSLDSEAGLATTVGPFARIELSKSGRHFTYQGSFTDISPDFSTRLGFIPRVDVRQTQQYVSYYFWPVSGPVQTFGPSLTISYNLDHSGKTQDKTAYADFLINLKGTTTFRAGRYEAYEYYLGSGFRYGRTDASFYTAALPWIALYGSTAHGTGLNYAPGPGLSPFLATATDLSFGFTFRPEARLRLDPVYLFSRLAGPQTGLPAQIRPAASIYNNHQIRLKANYQFTKALSCRAILDYTATLPNSALVSLDKYKSFRGDYLVTYLVSPGTVLYAGYTDLLENYGITGGSFGMLPSPTSRNARQVYVKVSYVFAF